MKADKNVCKKGGGILLIGIALLCICWHISMLLYRGGNQFVYNSVNFSFTLNFLSDLGRITGWKGNSNFPSEIFFSLGMIFGGASNICFLRQFPENFGEHTKSHFLGRVGTIIGLFSMIGYIGIICIPSDLNYNLHLIMVLIAFGPIPVIYACFGLAGYLSLTFPRQHVHLYFAMFIGMLIYVLSMVMGPNLLSGDENAIYFHIIAQKIAIIFQISMLALIGWATFHREMKKFNKLVTIKDQTHKIDKILVIKVIRNHLEYRKNLLLVERRITLPVNNRLNK
jgi:hypothetical protein